MFLKKAIYFFPALILFSFFLPSCAGRINGSLRRDGSVELSLELGLEPRMSALIRSFSSLSENAPQNTPVIDGPALAKSMAAAPGIESVSLKNLTPSSIAGTIRISRIDRFLALPQKAAPANPAAASAAAPAGISAGRQFITYTPAQPPIESSLQIFLDLASAPLIFSMISEDVRDYLSILGAPAATGEQLSRAGYLDLVESFYKKPLADEIAAARINVIITFPGPVTAVKGGTFSGTQARFTIPLMDLLVLDVPLDYEVVWK
jgi:hypothetical protein